VLVDGPGRGETRRLYPDVAADTFPVLTSNRVPGCSGCGRRGPVVRRWLTVEVSSEDVFAGEICGVGSTLGVRAVVGRWPVSPFGSVADAMVEDPNGRRVFIAQDEGLADYVSTIYSFDEVIVAPVDCERGQDRLWFRGGPLRLDVSVGHRDGLGWALRTVPHGVATNQTWVTFTDVLARVLLRGVRTRGSTPGGTELYAATDRHRVTAIDGCWYDQDLGELRDVDPPVRFGFSSTPRQPSIVEVTTIVRRSGG
jgi:hypothetical protein